MSETELRPRIVGLENEFGWRHTINGETPDTLIPDIREAFISLMPGELYALSSAISGQDYFLQNGARYYLDLSSIPEYATPECLSFAEAVAYDIEGEEHVVGHARNAVQEGILSKILLNKRVVDHSSPPKTRGAHENFHVDKGRSEHLPNSDYFSRALGAHLASRVIYTGAGSVSAEGEFHKSQKLRNLDREICGGTTKDKPVVNTRDQSLGTRDDYRVHVIAGDSNISPWATWMKLGTTSLVIRLLEHDMFPDEVRLDSILTAAHVFGSGTKIDTYVYNHEGKKMSALEVQKRILDRVIQLSELVDLPQEEFAIIDEWAQILYDIEGDIDICADRIDWVLRRDVVEKAGSDSYARRKRDLNYDLLYPRKGYGALMRDRGFFREVPGMKIDTMLPPTDTRALVRGIGVQALSQITELRFNANWDRFAGNKPPVFMMSDPYSKEIGELVNWIDKIKVNAKD